MKATQQLKDEHEGILLMLKIMTRMMSDFQKNFNLNKDHFVMALDFIKGFADKCHHGKEERILFPAMEAKGISHNGGPICVMLSEHEQGRSYINGLNNSFEEFRNGNGSVGTAMILLTQKYIDLLRSHIEKENNVLFMMADRILDEKEQDEIFLAFEKLEEDVIGKGKHEEYHALLDELKSIYL